MHIMQYRSECNGKCLHGCWAHTVLYTTCSISVPKTRHTPLHLLQPLQASFLLEIQIIFRHKQYLYYESIYIYDVETRHIPLHLLQPWQDWVLSGDSDYFWAQTVYYDSIYICFKNQTYTVASAPTVTGSGFIRRFRLFLGPWMWS